MNEPKVLPFYMAYPLPMGNFGDMDMVHDLEYFQQLYPRGAKRLHKRIVKSLDILDYEGSMIYDEYPDQLMIRRMSRDIVEKMRKEESQGEDDIDELLANANIEEYVLLLVMNEMLRRRHECDKRYHLL